MVNMSAKLKQIRAITLADKLWRNVTLLTAEKRINPLYKIISQFKDSDGFNEKAESIFHATVCKSYTYQKQ
jgi:hypothetical protein